jgi:uncharacterized protein (TIGR02996 family)
MPTPAEDDAFLEPILARYTDDGPRLIYADYLAESHIPADVARGELIRIQCALSRLPGDDPRRPDLVACEAELLQEYRSIWGEGLSQLVVGWEFRRGLLDVVSIDAQTFLARGDELFRRAPIRRVRILDAARHLPRLVNCPFLTSVRELDLCGNDLGNGGVNLLLRSPYLTAVESLDLSFNGVCDGGVRLLALSSALPRLRELALNDNGQISGDGLAQLAASHHFAGLRVLDISGNDVNDSGVRAVVHSSVLTRLHTFRVFANHIGDAGIATLVDSSLLARMLARDSILDLRQNCIGEVGAAILASATSFESATALDLSGNYIGDEGLSALSRLGERSQLRKLSVRQNGISDRGAFALAKSPLIGKLLALDISANKLSRKGIEALWASRTDWRTVIEWSDNLASPDVYDPATPDDQPPPHRLDQTVGEVLRRLVPTPRVKSVR